MSNFCDGDKRLNKIKTLEEFSINVIYPLLVVGLVSIVKVFSVFSVNHVFATTENSQNLVDSQSHRLPDINIKHSYDTKSAVIGNSVMNLFIFIAGGTHQGNDEDKESRFIEHTFLPPSAIIDGETYVIWFGGNNSHEHRIINNVDGDLFDNDEIPKSSASNPMVPSVTGDYRHYITAFDQESVKKGFAAEKSLI